MGYSFCESVTGIGPWHIRPLSEKGRKCGGGIDTATLCGRVSPSGEKRPDGKPGFGGWDLEVEITEHHLGHACPQCVEEYRKQAAG